MIATARQSQSKEFKVGATEQGADSSIGIESRVSDNANARAVAEEMGWVRVETLGAAGHASRDRARAQDTLWADARLATSDAHNLDANQRR
jgi:hypothetical protein